MSALDQPVSYPTAQDQGGGGTYVVQPGDTLSEIADQLGVSPETLTRYNGTTDPDLIYSGEPLYYPAGTGGYGATGYTAIDDPSQPGGYTNVGGENVAGNGAYSGGGATVPIFVSGDRGFSGDIAPGGSRYLLPATGGGTGARS